MSIVVWIILGFICGGLANRLSDATRDGLRDLVIGASGAVIGGAAFEVLGEPAFSGFLATTGAAAASAVAALWLFHSLILGRTPSVS